jgi:hypothetical protein
VNCTLERLVVEEGENEKPNWPEGRGDKQHVMGQGSKVEHMTTLLHLFDTLDDTGRFRTQQGS